MSSISGLPWQNYEDVQLFVNEYIHPSSLNRGYRRLLENDRYIETLLTPKDVAGTFSASTKKIEIVAPDGNKYYIDLKTKN